MMRLFSPACGEDSGAGGGCKDSSLTYCVHLPNVARASLSDELLRDYETFLRQRGLRVWPKDSHEALAMRSRLAQDQAANVPRSQPGVVRLTGLFGLTEFVEKAAPELAANAMLCAVNQAAYLLKRQLESQGETFLEKGGFTEKLYGARKRGRMSDGSDASEDSPTCPLCGKPIRLRTARKGLKAGQSFWGCSGYPDCRGTLPAMWPRA